MRAALLLLAASCAASPLAAQETPPLDASAVPRRAARVADFVPAGWRVALQVDGDLNGDGRPDHVLHLVPRGATYEYGAVSAGPETSALVIVLTGADGALSRGGVAGLLLQQSMPQWGLQLTIRRGVLIVNQNYGMSDVWDLTHRFRWDAASGRFVLIGRDVFTYHRPQGMYDTEKTSENYLTGQRLVTIGHWTTSGGYRETNRREAIPRRSVPLEAVDETSP
jgi:hypothetical protein